MVIIGTVFSLIEQLESFFIWIQLEKMPLLIQQLKKPFRLGGNLLKIISKFNFQNIFIKRAYYKKIDSVIKWKMVKYPKHSFQKDSFNCGIFCIKFLECLLTKKTLKFSTKKDSLFNIRLFMLKTLISIK